MAALARLGDLVPIDVLRRLAAPPGFGGNVDAVVRIEEDEIRLPQLFPRRVEECEAHAGAIGEKLVEKDRLRDDSAALDERQTAWPLLGRNRFEEIEEFGIVVSPAV